MNINELTEGLCALYESAGFKKFKMRKFEEYSLYLENKSFLTSEYVITFNDLSGKLLALKPDVTLSILKNAKALQGGSEKLYYTESVYRLDRRSLEYKEISQAGLEIIGEIGLTETAEILLLALRSLSLTGREFTLDISHMGITDSILTAAVGENLNAKKEIIDALSAKSTHDLLRVIKAYGISEEHRKRLLALPSLSRNFSEGLEELSSLAGEENREYVEELRGICRVLSELGYGDSISLDFSIINDSEYYNGVVFKGYVSGIHRHVLSGGRYDKLSGKFRVGSQAMGFAVYLGDLLSSMPTPEYDCDILLLYAGTDDPYAVIKEAEALRSAGAKVRIEKEVPEGLRYREIKEAGKNA